MVPTIIPSKSRAQTSGALLSKPLHFKDKESKDVFTVKSTYIVLLIYNIPGKNVSTVFSTLKTEAVVSLVHLSLIPTGRKYRIKRHYLLRMRTTRR